MGNSDKQNAKYLGEFSRDEVWEIVEMAANMPDEAMRSEKDFAIRQRARNLLANDNPKPAYFIGTEDGIEDIDEIPYEGTEGSARTDNATLRKQRPTP